MSDESWRDCPVCDGTGLVSEYRAHGDYDVPCRVCVMVCTLRAGKALVEKCLLKELETRDRYAEALQDTHVELGGDGEWTCKVPCPRPPESGELDRDVPVFASLVLARADRAEAKVKRLREVLAPFAQTANNLKMLGAYTLTTAHYEAVRNILEDTK